MAAVIKELHQQARSIENVKNSLDENMRAMVEAVTRIKEVEKNAEAAGDAEVRATPARPLRPLRREARDLTRPARARDGWRAAAPHARQRTNVALDQFKEAVLSLATTETRMAGHKRAFEQLIPQLEAERGQDAVASAAELRTRLCTLAKDEATAAVAAQGDFAAHARVAEIARACAGGSAGGCEDGDEEVQCTQEAFDHLCPLLKMPLVRPTKVVPCFASGATRCVFSKEAIENHVRQGRGSAKCPQIGCPYSGFVQLHDLKPCKETERKLKRYMQESERQKLQREKDMQRVEDDDAIDEEEGITQI